MAYIVRKKLHAKCPFCEEKVEPFFGEPRRLKGFLTDKGKILARSRSGVCQKHQRQLAAAVKRARHLALLPHVSVLH
jgi:small subunit ribosomal protein S18